MGRARRLVTARPWISAGVAALVAGGAVAVYAFTGDSSVDAQDGAITRLTSASIGTVKESVSATGTIAAADEEDVSFSSSAEVTSVRVSVGDKVKKGEVLGTIDTLALKAALAEARSTLASAKATLASAEDSGTATYAQLSAYRSSVATAKSSVAAAKSALGDATLRAPISGTVAEVNLAKGDQATGSADAASNAASGDTGSSADFVVLGMKKWTVSATVDDTEVGLLEKGQQVQITTSNVRGTVFGVVSSVAVLSSSTSGSATYPVEIDVTGTPTGLHDGASATADIIYKQVSNVLTVPTAAVHTDNATSYVYVSSDGKKVKTTVTTGLSSGGTTEIKSGLKSGQQVYLEISTGGGGSSTSTGGSILQRGDFPAGGVLPNGGQFPVGGNAPVTGGGGK